MREKHNAYHKAYNKKYSEARCAQNRALLYKRKYAITVEDYDKMLIAQAGVCAICKRTNIKTRLAVDHNHDTGQVRELLCTRCNPALGWFEKNRTVILEYLDRWGRETKVYKEKE